MASISDVQINRYDAMFNPQHTQKKHVAQLSPRILAIIAAAVALNSGDRPVKMTPDDIAAAIVLNRTDLFIKGMSIVDALVFIGEQRAELLPSAAEEWKNQIQWAEAQFIEQIQEPKKIHVGSIQGDSQK